MSEIKSLYILKGGIRVIFTDTEPSTLSEAWAYANYVMAKEDGKKPLEITVHRLGDYADINWIMQSKPFERIRRITAILWAIRAAGTRQRILKRKTELSTWL